LNLGGEAFLRPGLQGDDVQQCFGLQFTQKDVAQRKKPLYNKSSRIFSAAIFSVNPDYSNKFNLLFPRRLNIFLVWTRKEYLTRCNRYHSFFALLVQERSGKGTASGTH